MRYFGTLFNINYLDRGLSLYDSLKEQNIQFKLFVLCLDSETFDYLTKHQRNEIVPIKLESLENEYPELLVAKANRSIVEYFFTLSPVLPLYILSKFIEVDLITTLDADIYFYSSPEPIYNELGENSVLITPHRFEGKLKEKEIYGLYNVSFQMFRKDEVGLACLQQWKSQCIDWCFDKMEDGKFADQLYLNTWQNQFKKVKVLDHIGAGLAPWNIGNYEISLKNDIVMVNNVQLIFYHFHGLKFLSKNLILHGLDPYKFKLTKVALNSIFKPYILALLRNSTQKTFSVHLRKSYSNKDVIKKILKGGVLKINKNNKIVSAEILILKPIVWVIRQINGTIN